MAMPNAFPAGVASSSADAPQPTAYRADALHCDGEVQTALGGADDVRDEVDIDAEATARAPVRGWQFWMTTHNASDATRRGLAAARCRIRSFRA